MAITRILQTGFEWHGIGNESETEWLFPNAISTVPPGYYNDFYTGERCISLNTGSEGKYTAAKTSISQCRIGGVWKITGVNSGDSPDLYFLVDDGTGVGSPVIRLRYDHSNTQLEALCGATEVGTYSIDLTEGSPWYQIGMDVKIDGAAGWFYVYINGTAVISFSGDTNDGGADFNQYGFGPAVANQNFNNGFLDDLYIDNTTGEGAAACPPLYRFHRYELNGDGNYSQWLGSDGNSVNNYALVDEVPPNTADYVEHDTTTEKDTYASIVNGTAISPGATINAVIPYINARKDDGATALDLSPMTRSGGVDEVGSAQSLTVNYEYYWERFTTDPSAAAWTKTTVDGMEIGIQVD